MLQVENLNQYYGGSHILRGLSFTAEPGKVTTLLGRNGVGKTTLLKSLMGVVPTRSGSIQFGGADITKLASYDRVRAGIGYVPQGREIFFAAVGGRKSAHGAGVTAGQHADSTTDFLKCFRCSSKCCDGAVAICLAANSSNWQSAGRWRWGRSC